MVESSGEQLRELNAENQRLQAEADEMRIENNEWMLQIADLQAAIEDHEGRYDSLARRCHAIIRKLTTDLDLTTEDKYRLEMESHNYRLLVEHFQAENEQLWTRLKPLLKYESMTKPPLPCPACGSKCHSMNECLCEEEY